MLRQISVGQVVLLQGIFIPFVSIDGVSPNCVADQSSVASGHTSAERKLAYACDYDLINPIEDIVSILEAIEEISKLGVVSES